MFWSIKQLNVVNSESQARDFLASERNFLTNSRAAFTMLVAASAVIFRPQSPDPSWPDWALVGVMLALAGSLPVIALHNYIKSFNGFCAEATEVHNSWLLMIVVLVVGVAAILVAAREFTRG